MKASPKCRPGAHASTRSQMQTAPLTPGPGLHRGTAPTPATKVPPLRQQIEAYFSDDGLKQDRDLYDTVASSPDGWVDIDVVLDLRLVKAARAKREDVLRALASSWLETYRDPDGTAAVRRPREKVLPMFILPEKTAPKQSLKRSNTAVQAQTAPARSTLFPGRLQGAVASYNEETGSAHIACAQTQALFQQDVTVDWRELERAGTAVDVGSLVSFRIELDEAGAPQARDLQLRAPAEAEEDEDVVTRPQKRRKGQETGFVPPVGAVGDRFIGTIKSFHEGVGVGFIACKAAYAVFGRDVTIDQHNLAGFRVGETVSFELATDDLGTPKALELEAAGSEDFARPVRPATPSKPLSKPATKPLSKPATKPLSKPVTKALSKPQAASTGKPLHKAASKPLAKPAQAAGGLVVGTRIVGVVKSFNEKVGVGMITSPALLAQFKRDATVKVGDLAGFSVGDNVSFELSKHERFGYPIARELEAE